MNTRMNHRFEVVHDRDGSWTIHELVDRTTVGRIASLTRRDAQSEAVRLNRQLLRDAGSRMTQA